MKLGRRARNTVLLIVCLTPIFFLGLLLVGCGNDEANAKVTVSKWLVEKSGNKVAVIDCTKAESYIYYCVVEGHLASIGGAARGAKKRGRASVCFYVLSEGRIEHVVPLGLAKPDQKKPCGELPDLDVQD
jgi:hypothetical protein